MISRIDPLGLKIVIAALVSMYLISLYPIFGG
jgi:hypothetical protein